MNNFRVHCSTSLFALGLISFQLLQVHGNGNVVAQEKEMDTPSGTASDAEIDKRSKVLADPTDFSRPPTLPQLAKLDSERLEAAIQNGIQYMVAKQNSNGSWGSPTRTKSLNIYAPVPGAHHAFRAATTSLGISALIESGSDQPSVQQAIDRAAKELRLSKMAVKSLDRKNKITAMPLKEAVKIKEKSMTRNQRRKNAKAKDRNPVARAMATDRSQYGTRTVPAKKGKGSYDRKKMKAYEVGAQSAGPIQAPRQAHAIADFAVTFTCE